MGIFLFVCFVFGIFTLCYIVGGCVLFLYVGVAFYLRFFAVKFGYMLFEQLFLFELGGLVSIIVFLIGCLFWGCLCWFVFETCLWFIVFGAC